MSAELEEKGDIAELKELGIHDDSQSVSSSTNSNQWCECNKACYRRRAKLIWRTGSLGLVVLVYLLIGAGIFTAIERPNEVEENEMITESSDNYTRLLNQLVDVLTNTTNYTRNQSIELIEAIVTFAAETAQQPLSDWEYGSSLFFVVTVVTTIGNYMYIPPPPLHYMYIYPSYMYPPPTCTPTPYVHILSLHRLWYNCPIYYQWPKILYYLCINWYSNYTGVFSFYW